MAKANFVDKEKFYEALKKRYEIVLEVKERQKKYYKMINNAKGDDFRKEQLKEKVKQKLHQIPIDDYIGECILKICQNLIRKKGFIEYSRTHAEDMIGDAVENSMLYISSFDPRRSNQPFSYFTQVASWAFVRRIEKEKREIYFKLRSLHNMDGLMDNSHQEDYDDNYDGKLMSDDWLIHTRNYVNEYEEKMEKKRKNQKRKKEKKSIATYFNSENKTE